MINSLTLRAGFLLAMVVTIGIAAHSEHPRDPAALVWISAGHLSHVAAYAIAFVLCRRIRNDYRSSPMRLAWTMMAASAAMAVLRHAFEAVVFLKGWAVTYATAWVGFRQIPIVLSLLLLAAGLSAMWSSYTSLGLGLRFRGWDALVAAAMIAAVCWILPLRASLNDARSVHPLVRNLQSASPVLLAIPALLGLVLHRISQEMGGGRLAVSLRYLVAFLAFRMAGLLMGVSPALSPHTALPSTAAFHAASWLFALAVFERCQFTVAAEDLARRYAVNPDAEIRQLTGDRRA